VDWWVIGGQRRAEVARIDNAGERFKGPEAMTLKGKKYEDSRRGGHDPEAHVKENEADGVWASVLYPSVGLIIFALDEPAFNVCCRAYNEWIAEFCSAMPGRLYGIGCLDADDPERAAADLAGIHQLGLRGALISVSPKAGSEYDRPQFDSLWSAAQELEMPLSLHIATNRDPTVQLSLLAKTALLPNVDHYVRDSLSRMIMSGVFERFPRLKVISVEHEIGWAPHFVERLDYTYTQRTHRPDRVTFADDKLPSHFFRDNVRLSFQEDEVGIENRNRIGIDTLMWGSDYPHTESTFPRSRQILENMFSGVDAEEFRKITCTNAADLYNVEVPGC
jgi:predicted TIM-barrel fold metal-dependent hydrolase